MPVPVYRKLAQLTSDFAAGLKTDPVLASALNSNPKGFRQDVEHLIRAQFRLKRGPHTDPRIDEACRLVLEEHKSVPQVLRSQITDWSQLDPYTRLLASKGLHQALKRRGAFPRPRKIRKAPLKSRNRLASRKSPLLSHDRTLELR